MILFIALITLSPFIYFTAKLVMENRYARYWEGGIFPVQLEYDRDNLMEAYICLAARMIQSNTEDAGEKILYMNSYFCRYFPESHYDFGESISYMYRHPIQLKSVATWMNIHFRNKQERIQVLYFLTGLSLVDGKIRQGEMLILENMRELLKLIPGDLNSIINIYLANNKEHIIGEAIENKKEAILLSSQILGVSPHAGIDEIKRAYLKQSLLHHPDRFKHLSEDHQRLAMERFIRVQKAFELLKLYKFQGKG